MPYTNETLDRFRAFKALKNRRKKVFYNCSNKINIFIRDVCSVVPRPKSEVKKRLEDILQAQRADLILEVEEGLPKKKDARNDLMPLKDIDIRKDQASVGYNEYRREVKEFLKGLKE